MSDIHRFSSRRERLDHAFLGARMKEAKSYKRIAGYFRSSIFELVGEEIAAILKVQFLVQHWGQPGPDGTVARRADPAHKFVSPVALGFEESRGCWSQITAPVLWVEGAGHNIHHDQPEALAALIEGFA